MKKNIIFIIVLSVIILSGSYIKVISAVKGPDFAYPKNVTTESETGIKQALKIGDDIMLLRSLMDYSIAQTIISQDNASTVINKINLIKENEKDGITIAMLDVILADIYHQLYENKRYIYDNRTAIENDTITDYTQWSGKKFNAVVAGYIADAMKYKDELQSAPIEKYSEIIEIPNRYTAIYYPTLYDFVVYKAIALCYENIIASLKMYDDLFAFHKQQRDTACIINTEMSRLKLLHSKRLIDNNEYIDSLNVLYDRMQNNEYSGDVLIAFNDEFIYGDDINAEKDLLKKIEYSLDKFPQYYNADCLKLISKTIKNKEANVAYKTVVCRGKPLELKLTSQNVDSLTVNIYKLLKTNRYGYYQLNDSNSKLVKTIPLKFKGAVPFKQDTTIYTTIDEYGNYIIALSFKDGTSLSKKRFNQPLLCSDLFMYVTNFRNDLDAWVVNPLTGLPIQNCTILEGESQYGSMAAVGKTNNNGSIAIVNEQTKFVKAVNSGDCYMPRVWVGYKNDFPNDDENRYNYMMINTDLAIYHPGDTVKWNVVDYVSGQNPHIIVNEDVKILLYNANRELIDSKMAKTDEWGRAEGFFVLPENGLMGDYSIRVKIDEIEKGYKAFKVSDYKLPAFFVGIDEIKKDSIGNVIVKGSAKTYSGFPVANAPVDMVLFAEKFSLWRERSGNRIEVTSKQVETDEYGLFEIKLGKDLFSNIPKNKIVYQIDVAVTSETGETRFASSHFSNEYSTVIGCDINYNLDVDKPVELIVTTTDLNSTPINSVVCCILRKESKTVFEDTIRSGKNLMDWSGLKGGMYTLILKVAEDSVERSLYLYHLTDTISPDTDRILWLPESRYESSGDKVSVVYGTTLAETNINCMLYTNDGIISQRWIKVASGIHTIEVDLPENEKSIMLELIAVGDYGYETQSVFVSRKKSQLNVDIESFRDDLMPGDREKWTIKVSENNDSVKPIQAGILLNMYNKALDELNYYKLMNFNLWDYHYSIYTEANSINFVRNWNIQDIKRTSKDCISISIPEFETYHHSLVKGHIRPYLEMKSVRLTGVVKNEVAFGSMDSDVVLEESVEQMTDNETKTTDDFVYRDVETVSAFFNPMLTTDSLGQMEFTFTVPNANGAWNVVAFAFTKDLLNVQKKYEVTTSKPIMVQSNVPRFLRGGDKTAVKASVMNNTDSTVVAKTVIELFDVATGKVLKRKEVESEIMSMASVVVGIEIDAPQDMVMIGYRIKSSIAKYADGEQTAITILPSVTPVVESKSFYMPPSDAVCNLTLPAIKGLDGRATLQYTENPIWYCVTALPGLRVNKNNTSISAMTAIFSAAIAEDVVRKNQDIASALYHWGETKDSTLMSMLDRNEDLKVALLSATPWVMDAKDDTERMARISLLFDSKNIKSTYSENIKTLSKLKASDGGFCWFAGSKYSSEWVTLKIVKLYGRMRQLGCAPENKDLKTMIDGAVKYLDNQYVESYEQNNYNINVPLDYVYIRMMYPEIRKSSKVNSIIAKSVQGIIANWRNYTVKEKAISAIILEQMGYHATAMSLLKSIEEYAIYEPSRGMYWYGVDLDDVSSILNAFYQVSPESSNVEKIRQWLILQKENQNWGNSVRTTDIIASILETGNAKLPKSYQTEIRIGGTELMPSEVDETLGYFRMDVSSMLKTNEDLSIVRPAGQPSWGSIVYQYIDKIKDVEAAGGDGISITKNIYVRELTDRGEVWLKTSSYKIGDVVKVQLTIKSEKTIDYVMVKDERAACLEPIEQMPQPKTVDGIMFYQEVGDDCSNFFVDRLPKGTYIIDYDMVVNSEGEFSSGIATIQSQYTPSIVAHSAGGIMFVDK